MQSRYSEADAQALVERYADRGDVNHDLALRVYTSRLIGGDPALVLHGGGNTSVKTTRSDELGASVAVLCVKGSGGDLATIGPEGLPAVRLAELCVLEALAELSDEAMVNALRTRLLVASAPTPSIETLLHAFLPAKFVDHSHADALLALLDQDDAEALCRELFGDTLAFVPYVKPGFELAKLAAAIARENPAAEGLLLHRHGLFTWGATARESYERHVEAVDRAERFVAARRGAASARTVEAIDYAALAPVLRGRLGEGDRRYVLELRTSPAIRSFVDRAELAELALRGTATPDHVIRTKRLPLLLEPAGLAGDALVAHVEERIASYREEYRAYVARETASRTGTFIALDPDPRVVLVPGLGLVGVGGNAKAARIAADIYEHTVTVITDAEVVGRYAPLPASDLFDMEYWSLEQAKLGTAKKKRLEGQVVYLTGAGRGLGEAIARAFAAEGAELYLVDRDASPLAAVARALGAAHEQVDVTDESAVRASIGRAVALFGGLDGVVSNAGAAEMGAMHTASEALRRSFEINFFSHQHVAAAATAVLLAQDRGGFLLFNASKSAFNPGADFGPYAIPKAAVIALMKQYALEYGARGIRSNAVNADRIRTGLLPAEDIEKRAIARGLAKDVYYRANLLGREVVASEVADAFVHLALAPSTTAGVVTVDGGNIAASPR